MTQPKKIRVLVVDDSAQMREKLSEIINSDSDCEVIATAKDGEEAVIKFMENRETVRLLLFDLIMPRKNGREACDEIRKIKPEVKVIFTSGYPADVIRKKGVLDEADLFLFKPASPRETLHLVQNALSLDPC